MSENSQQIQKQTKLDTQSNSASPDEVPHDSPMGLQAFLDNPNQTRITPDVAIALQRTIGNRRLIQLLRKRGAPIQRDPDGTDASGNNPNDMKAQLNNYMQGQLDRVRQGTVELFHIGTNHIKNIASDTGGSPLIPGAKGMDRIIAKAEKKIAAGRADNVDVGTQIKDILRGTIVYNTFDELQAGYQHAVKTLKGHGLTFTKMAETFTQGGKEANARSKGTEVDTSGYGDAKLVFNIDVPPRINRRYFAGMQAAPKVIPVELQFQTKAGLAVKSGKLGDADPDGEWNYRIDPVEENGRWRFNAVQFLGDMIGRMEANNTVQPADHLLLGQLPVHGLPPAHDVYDPEKKALMDDSDIENAETFYPQLYEVAFRYSQMTDNSADELSGDITRLKKKYKRYFV